MGSNLPLVTIAEEKRRQKADLLLAHQESEENLASFSEEASAVAANLREVATLIETARPKKTNCGVLVVEERLAAQQAARHEKIIADGRYRRAMNLDAVLDLVSRLQDAKQQRDELRERKSALGLS